MVVRRGRTQGFAPNHNLFLVIRILNEVGWARIQTVLPDAGSADGVVVGPTGITGSIILRYLSSVRQIIGFTRGDATGFQDDGSAGVCLMDLAENREAGGDPQILAQLVLDRIDNQCRMAAVITDHPEDPLFLVKGAKASW